MQLPSDKVMHNLDHSKLQLLQSKLKAGEDSTNTLASFENGFYCPIRKLAEQDLIRIWLYWFKLSGAEQADDHLRAMFSRFDYLKQNPSLGEKRDDVKTGYYCFPQGKHLIFYTITVNGIDVIGIPHQSMDVVDYLG
jgi:toxin ParE1/3/4